MPEQDRPLLDDVRREASRLGEDVWRMLDLRRQLAEIEYRTARLTLKRFFFLTLVATGMVATGLPLLVATAAEVLDDYWLNRTAWLAIIGGFLVFDGLIVGLLSWFRFRRQFTPFQATLDELREDVAWLRDRGTLGDE